MITSIKIQCISPRCKFTKTLTGDDIEELKSRQPSCDKCYMPMTIVEVKGSPNQIRTLRDKGSLEGNP